MTEHEDLLGIWALGPMVTRFVAVRLPARAHERADARRRCAAPSTGLGDLMDDYEFHYPGELYPDNLDEVRDALDGHGIATICTGLHRDPRFGTRRADGARRGDAGGGAPPHARGGRARRRASAPT